MRTIHRIKRVTNLGSNDVFVDRDFSPAAGASIWDGCPMFAMLQDPAVGILYREDFLSLAIDDVTGNPCGWKWVSDTATGAATLPKVAGGVLQLATGPVDNNESYLQLGSSGGLLSAPFFITDANSKPLWFEAYVKVLEVADLGVFIGLAEEGAAVADFLTDNSGVIADKDFVGFNILTATPAAWNVTWKKAGQAVQTIVGAAVNAADWHRFGFVFDGLHTVTFYIDRVAHATTALASATTFPSGQQLAPIIAVKTGEGVLKRVQVDYLAVAQIR